MLRYHSCMQIVVSGGYGNFGARICRALARDVSLSVIAAGRNPGAAPADFSQLGIRTATLDMTAPDFAATLRQLKPDIVIHCIGPFQGQDYGVAKAALACGAHYIDLSDGRDFVAGFGAVVDANARAANRLAVSGASTLPGLSSAVVDAYRSRFVTLESIETVIAPAQSAPRGVATLAGVMSYAGRPFQVWRHSTWRTVYGWQEVKTVTVGPLGKRLSALCDVPDLALFPVRYPGVKHVDFRAALEVGIQHRAIAALAGLRRIGVPLPIARMAPAWEWMARRLDRFGSATGGMTVTMSGMGVDNNPLALRWHVIAPENHGPQIPCMAAILLARKLAAGTMHEVGAMPCMGLVPLDDFAPEFARWGMTCAVEELR